MQEYETKRGAERIRVKLPVQLEDGTGITRDVSRSGVFFFTDRSVAPDMPLRFRIELQYAFPGEPVLLHCMGKVVRVEEAGERTGVAVSISEFRSAA